MSTPRCPQTAAGELL